jgi:hypothetical protein
MAFYLPKVLMSIMHKKLMQIVLVKGLDIQDIVTLKKYDKKVKKFLTNKIGDDILIKLSARKADDLNTDL